MSGFFNHKLAETVESDNHIYDDTQFRTCDFEVTDTGEFLNLKCYSSKERSKNRRVRICLTDFLFQIWRKLASEQQKELKAQIDGITSN